MLPRVLGAGVVAALWVVVRIIEWLDPQEYDEPERPGANP